MVSTGISIQAFWLRLVFSAQGFCSDPKLIFLAKLFVKRKLHPEID